MLPVDVPSLVKMFIPPVTWDDSWAEVGVMASASGPLVLIESTPAFTATVYVDPEAARPLPVFSAVCKAVMAAFCVAATLLVSPE